MPTITGIVSSQALAVTTGASAQFAAPMVGGCQYILTTEVDVWCRVTSTGGAAAADTANNTFVKAGIEYPLCNLEDSGSTNSFVHLIAQSTNGDATLVQYASKLA